MSRGLRVPDSKASLTWPVAAVLALPLAGLVLLLAQPRLDRRNSVRAGMATPLARSP